MGEGGLEPPRPEGHWHLKPARLPFRHSPVAVLMTGMSFRLDDDSRVFRVIAKRLVRVVDGARSGRRAQADGPEAPRVRSPDQREHIGSMMTGRVAPHRRERVVHRKFAIANPPQKCW